MSTKQWRFPSERPRWGTQIACFEKKSDARRYTDISADMNILQMPILVYMSADSSEGMSTICEVKFYFLFISCVWHSGVSLCNLLLNNNKSIFQYRPTLHQNKCVNAGFWNTSTRVKIGKLSKIQDLSSYRQDIKQIPLSHWTENPTNTC